MYPKLLCIGSIGVVTETSDYQRRAYNQAMTENGLDWNWTPETYRELLKSCGGKDRLRLLAAATNHPLSEQQILAIHARKTEIACQSIVKDKVTPRPGVVQLIKAAKEAGTKVAWVTSTYPENTTAVLEASNGQLKRADFEHIFHRQDVEEGKPAADIYNAALQHFAVAPNEVIAIEDTLVSILAAKKAGIFSISTLGAFHDDVLDNIADVVLPNLAHTDWTELVRVYQDSQAMMEVVY
ncbi:MAG: HAD-IA family hydrolase [Bacteroidota bacterium]